MDAESGESTRADRGALSLIGLLLAAATLMVTITAVVAVSDYGAGMHGDYRVGTYGVAALPPPPMKAMLAVSAAVK